MITSMSIFALATLAFALAYMLGRSEYRRARTDIDNTRLLEAMRVAQAQPHGASSRKADKASRLLCASCEKAPAEICDLCLPCEEVQHASRGGWTSESLAKLRAARADAPKADPPDDAETMVWEGPPSARREAEQQPVRRVGS